MAKLPYMQFFVNDYLSDPGVRMCSIGARGLWFEMLCHMWMSPIRGYLCNASGQPLGCEEIARLVGEPAPAVKRLLEELSRNGVPSQDDNGAYYCRRMVREARLSEVRRSAVSKRRDRSFEGDLNIQNDQQKGLQRSGLLQKPEFRSENSEARSQNSDASGGLGGYPQFAAAAREYFPTVDDSLLEELIGLAIAEHPPITDVDLETVVRAATKPHQKQATLWRKTIPEVIRSWK